MVTQIYYKMPSKEFIYGIIVMENTIPHKQLSIGEAERQKNKNYHQRKLDNAVNDTVHVSETYSIS